MSDADDGNRRTQRECHNAEKVHIRKSAAVPPKIKVGNMV
jgi:hypothetical protein